MVTNVEPQPSTAIRRPTPFHPPYSLMIGVAIRSLDEERGSTVSSISDYIKANFDGLPWGHDRLMPYYVNKLIAEGEFVRGVEGRYLIAEDDDAAEEPEPRIIKRRSPDDGWKNRNNDMEDNDDEGVPIACEGDLVMQVQPLIAVSEPLQELLMEPREAEALQSDAYGSKSAPKRRGRRPKREAMRLVDPSSLVINGYVVEKARVSEEGNPVRRLQPLLVIEDDGSKPVPKRRGRPPKRKNDGDVEPMQFVDPSTLVINGNAVEETKVSEEVQPLSCSNQNVSSQKHKSKRSSNQDANEPTSPELQQGEEESKPVPKRCGRTPKSKPVLAGGKDEAMVVAKPAEKRIEKEATSAPKRRGRPPKVKPDIVNN